MRTPSHRPAFTILEVTVALALLGVLTSFVAQLAVWSVRQRQKTDARQVALELAGNVLESARATPWASLAADWAPAQKIPAGLADILPRAKLAVQVEAAGTNLRRVTVEVTWRPDENEVEHGVRLVTLVAARSAEGKGAQP